MGKAMKAIIDSDVLIDFLQGVKSAQTELAKYSRREISIVSWMEVMAGADGEAEEAGCRDFLATFAVHPVTSETAEEAVRLRRDRRLRLPDAIVWATARVNGALLVTRNTKDFPVGEPGIRVPYSL
jgi:predicted nucleic acid-binding protein